MNMFRTVFTVMRKELRDLSRDRRTLALALFLGPLLYPALMLGMGYLTENRIRTQVDKTLEVPMVGAEHAPNLVKFLATNGITAAPAPANLDTAIRSQEIDAALRISPDYAEDWRNGHRMHGFPCPRPRWCRSRWRCRTPGCRHRRRAGARPACPAG